MIRGEGGAPADSASVFESILTHAEGIVNDVDRLEADELLGLTAEDIENLRETGDNLARAGLLLTELTANLSADIPDEESMEFGSEESYGVVLRYLCITRKFQLVNGQELMAHLRKAGVEVGDATIVAIMEEIDEWASDIREDAREQLGVSGHIALIDDTHITFGDDGTSPKEIVSVASKPQRRRTPPRPQVVEEEVESISEETENEEATFREIVGQLLANGPMKASKLVPLLARETAMVDADTVREKLAGMVEEQTVYKYRNGSTYYTLDPNYEQYISVRVTQVQERRERSRERELDTQLATDILTVMTRPASHWQTKYRPEQIYRYLHPDDTRAIPEADLDKIRATFRMFQQRKIVNSLRAKRGKKSGGSGLSIKGARSASHELLQTWFVSNDMKMAVKNAIDSGTLTDFLEQCAIE
jgi:hypothetical protein